MSCVGVDDTLCLVCYEPGDDIMNKEKKIKNAEKNLVYAEELS